MASDPTYNQYQDPYANPYANINRYPGLKTGVDTSQIGAPDTNTGVVGPETPTYPTTATSSTKDPYALWQQYSQQNPNANIQGLIDYFNQNGVNATRATHANGTLPSDDKAIVNGQMIDFIGDAGGANTWQYNVEQPAGAGGTSSGPTSMGSAYTPSPEPTIPQFNIMDPRANDLYNTLLGRAQQGLNVSASDPIVAGQVDPYRAEQTRGVRDYLAQQAEAQGPNANLGAESRLANEHAAQATGGLQATLMGNELTARRNEIQNALSQMGSLLSDQQKIALQQELGQIDSNLRQQLINSNNDQFAAQLGFNQADRSSYWDALRSGLI